MKKLLIAFSATLTFASVFGAIRAVTPTVWSKDPNCWQMQRHNQKMKEVRAGGAPIVFIGDSITHFWETNGRNAWNKYFCGDDALYRAINLGTSADRTEHVLWRITEGGELDGYEAKVILLMIGTNNTGHFSADKETPMDTILGIREILHVLRKKQPKAKIVLTAIFPRGADRGNPLRMRNEVVNREICRYADGKHVFWVDFNDQLLTRDGRLLREIFPDLLHPAAFGYEIWFSAVKPYIDYALADGKLPAPPNRYAPSVQDGQFGNSFTALNPITRINEPNASRGLDWWSRRMLEKRNQIAASNGNFDLVMFGDSITHFWEYPEGAVAYPALTNRYQVLNLGYGGDRTENLIWRGLHGELTGYKARYVMLMIGTNNPGPADQVAAGIRRILAIIAEKHPESTVLLSPIFPRGHADDKGRAKNEQVNRLIRDCADGKKVRWLDFNAQLTDPDGEVKTCFCGDLLHPNEKGYDVWLKAMLPELEK